jgi:hypothetical protein
MSKVVTIGELAAAAADAYGAYQGGLGSPSNQASFGAAVAAGAATIASNGRWGPFPQGLGIGVAPAASVTQLGINIGNLKNPNATPAEKVAASLGIIGGAAGTLAGLMPPAAVLTPQGAAAKAALTGIAIAASAAQLGIQQNLGTVNELINDLVRNWNSLLNDLGDFFGDLFTRAKRWTRPRDPIILDLDGNGLETVGLAANVYFDFDGDGVLTKTGWAGANDALLVWDRNGNGRIDTGAELFGDFTVLPNGTLAPNGFAALAVLDANGDGVIDASDPAFAELKLWRDTSQDGKTGRDQGCQAAVRRPEVPALPELGGPCRRRIAPQPAQRLLERSRPHFGHAKRCPGACPTCTSTCCFATSSSTRSTAQGAVSPSNCRYNFALSFACHP